MVNVNFYNHGSYDLVLKSRKNGAVHSINQGQGTSTSISNLEIGDIFDVENKTDTRFRYRPIYITDPAITDIRIHGNPPFVGDKLTYEGIKNIDFDFNLFGINLPRFNPRLVEEGKGARPIFSGLVPGAIDYDFQGGKLVKSGMTLSEINRSVGSNDVKMAYSYSAFSKDWKLSLGVSGKANISGLDVKGELDLGVNSFENEERSSTNVYAYTREQKAVYQIDMDPERAYLDTDFIIAVKQINSVNDALEKIVKVYGTHYCEKVYYGGNRSLYVSMTGSTYAKAKGFGVDVKAKVTASKPGKLVKKKSKKKDVTTGSTDSSEQGSGSFGLSYSENQKEQEILKEIKGRYQAIGGDGGFNNWAVSEHNSVPIAVELDSLASLIHPSVFKDGTPLDILLVKKGLIEQAIDQHIKTIGALGKPLPPPRVYSVILSRLEVTYEVDDLNKKTKGTVSAVVTPPQEGFDGMLWNPTEFDTKNLRYKKGQFVVPNTIKTLVQQPAEDGSFAPLTLTVTGDIYEEDHAGGAERHQGQLQTNIQELTVGATQELKFDCKAFTTLAERGTIQVTVTIRREPSEFEDSILPFAKRLYDGSSSVAEPAQQPTAQMLTRPVFEPDFYIRSHNDLVNAYGYPNPSSAQNHWQSYGIGEGRKSSPAFDVAYYLHVHADLQNAFGAKNYRAAIDHWLTYGITEGRKSSVVFDPKFYLRKHADLQQVLGATNYLAAVNHWLSSGLREGRQGSAAFDPQYYWRANPDVATSYNKEGYMGAMAHFLEYGIKEGRQGFKPAETIGTPLESPVFETNFYVLVHSDLVDAFGYPNPNLSAAQSHWQNNGIGEGRKSSPAFDVAYYLQAHADLMSTFGAKNYRAAIDHWLTYGISEGRSSSVVFDPAFYLGKYADLQQALGATNYSAAVKHWLDYGVHEGRQGSAAFDPQYYWQANPDVAAAYTKAGYMGAIAHYLEYGIKEGRSGIG